jgi:hypothetical protein
LNQAKGKSGTMLCIERLVAAQATKTTKLVTAEQALEIANARFKNLRATGILGPTKRRDGPPIDPAHVTKALAVLSRCQRTAKPITHSHDLRRSIGDVSLGAVICAAVGLDFEVRSWSGVTDYAPHAMIGVDPADVERFR